MQDGNSIIIETVPLVADILENLLLPTLLQHGKPTVAGVGLRIIKIYSHVLVLVFLTQLFNISSPCYDAYSDLALVIVIVTIIGGCMPYCSENGCWF